jgi:enoyl-CoA hydratase
MSDTTSDAVTYELDGSVAVIRLDDGKANALSHQIIDGLDQALSRAEGDAAAAVVLVGRPGRFSAGFDLKTMQAGPEQARNLLRAGGELGLRIYTFPVPVVLAVTGHALAMGAILLMCADVRVGARGDFKIGLNEVAIGMPVPRFVTELAIDRLSKRHLTAAVNHAHIYDPETGVDAGFLDETTEAGALEERAMAVAGELASTLDPAAFRLTREHLRAESARRMEAGMASDAKMFSLLS